MTTSYASLYPRAGKLRFPPEIEKQFLEEYRVGARSTTRFALALGAALYALFGILDIYAVPMSKEVVWSIRFGIVVPVFVLIFASTYFKSFQAYIQPLACAAASIAGLGIVAMIAVTREVEFGNRFYVTGLLLVSMWTYGLSRLLFRYALIANLIIAVGYEVNSIWVKGLLETETGTLIFIIYNFFFLGANVLGAFTSFYLERFSRREFLQKYDIRFERDQVDSLLHNVIPGWVADKLKEGKKTIAEEIESASVLFVDIVNFTPISAKFGPHEVVQMLDDVFSLFDELVEKHKVEKIQVAGDGYMAAAGVPKPRPDHAHALARLALDMLKRVHEGNFLNGKHPIEIRIGLNSGSLIAGVIGRRKVFAVWGDMVNTASRMESHGVKNRIQITRAAYELLKDDFECEYVGEIQVKGKGQMEAWHLLGEKEKR
ncbi:MAG: adenylate/guanylate cyclase domain-containing protein [Anaerolineales bacterium]|nr:adenylate/guanylate cyclase domain-containing protein [Anaerolineales bacterium]